ncbi:MAG: uncharacterized protein KVP18_004413 [Porospora cf. gigantea A]|uniref:uncharacterized protein n=1 Tax=Porospora cf. gigantea A TaxID=2853593 RepID=UPI003559917F|nr:MAG: hypothetical protein KVP18_004413 [Porospora cf. gigantea A]
MSTFGIIAYLFEGVGVLLPIRSGMKTHLQPTMPRLLSRVVGCIFAVLCVFGTVAYLAFVG